MERSLLKNWKEFFPAHLLLDAGADSPDDNNNVADDPLLLDAGADFPDDNNNVANDPSLVDSGTKPIGDNDDPDRVIDNDDNNCVENRGN